MNSIEFVFLAFCVTASMMMANKVRKRQNAHIDKRRAFLLDDNQPTLLLLQDIEEGISNKWIIANHHL